MLPTPVCGLGGWPDAGLLMRCLRTFLLVGRLCLLVVGGAPAPLACCQCLFISLGAAAPHLLLAPPLPCVAGAAAGAAAGGYSLLPRVVEESLQLPPPQRGATERCAALARMDRLLRSKLLEVRPWVHPALRSIFYNFCCCCCCFSSCPIRIDDSCTVVLRACWPSAERTWNLLDSI